MSKFEKIRSHHIPTLGATVEEYVEPSTGARHIHLASEQSELVFLVAFPTVPDTSDGRAHILEHLALCGSERYPVRDPFFAMLRRSTATFMNAMTYADRTVYPFASTDRNDYFNLLDVYLDATFFPKLDYLNFLQEGWRYTLEDGKLNYQGVVFNEMKGAFSDPMRALYHGVAASQLRKTTYEVESGGDPLVIPQLSHQMLLDFHASHYHPSQAIFMTSGAVAAADIQQRISDNVLAKLSGKSAPMLPQLALLATAPRENTIRIPSQAAEDDDYGMQLSWLLGESADATAYYQADILSAGLLNSAAAPVQKAMESAGYGRPSNLNGFDPGARQMLFYLGMEGLTLDQIGSARQRIWDALEHTAVHGVPVETLQAALRDLKYSQRDTSGGRMPNMLGRLLQALPVAMYGGDVFGAIDSSAALARLETDIADPEFFKGLVRGLLDSPTVLTTTVVPDPDYFSARAGVEAKHLAAAQAALSDSDAQRIAADTAALEAHQDEEVDFSILPRIRPADVSTRPVALPAIPAAQDGKHVFPVASNGISYALVQYDVSSLPAELWPWLELYTELRAELGVAGLDYETAGAWQQTKAASFRVTLDGLLRQDGGLQVNLNFQTSGLTEEQAGMAEVLNDYIGQPRFDEHERMLFLIERLYQNYVNNLAQDGSRYAAIAASASLSTLGRFEDRTSGTGFLPFLGELMRSARTESGLAQIATKLAALHEQVVACNASVLSAAVGDDAQRLAALIALPAASATAAAGVVAAPAEAIRYASTALHADSQVNHCSIAWVAPSLHSDDAPALAVAAELLSHQLLHPSLREKGGAYGGYASYEGHAGVFSMASYRDPRLAATYADFSASVTQLLQNDFSDEQLEEAIVSVIKGLDKPKAPFDGVTIAWKLRQRGVDAAARQRFRSGVLGCSLAQVKAAVRKWLLDGQASRAAFAGNLTQDLNGLAVTDLHGLIKES